jgi:hypothetical protein
LILAVLDGEGVYGTFLNYSITLFYMGGALIVFFYLWHSGRLDMDEVAKLQMMKRVDELGDEEEEHE